MSGHPLERAQHVEDHQPAALVAAGSRFPVEVLTEGPRPVDLTQTHQESGQPGTWTLKGVQYEPVELFDLGAPFEEVRGDVGRPHLRRSDAAQRHGEQCGIARSFGPLERGSGVDEGGMRVGCEEMGPGARVQDADTTGVITGRFRQGFVAELDDRRHVGGEQVGQLEVDVGPFRAGRNLATELFKQRNRPLPVAGQTVQSRCPHSSLPGQGGIVRRPTGCELKELSPRRGRPAGGRVFAAAANSAATTSSGPLVARARWRALSSRSLTAPANAPCTSRRRVSDARSYRTEANNGWVKCTRPSATSTTPSPAASTSAAATASCPP